MQLISQEQTCLHRTAFLQRHHYYNRQQGLCINIQLDTSAASAQHLGVLS